MNESPAFPQFQKKPESYQLSLSLNQDSVTLLLKMLKVKNVLISRNLVKSCYILLLVKPNVP